MKGQIIKNVLTYWLLLLVALLASRYFGMPQDDASVVILIGAVTVVYFLISFTLKYLNRNK